MRTIKTRYLRVFEDGDSPLICTFCNREIQAEQVYIILNQSSKTPGPRHYDQCYDPKCSIDLRESNWREDMILLELMDLKGKLAYIGYEKLDLHYLQLLRNEVSDRIDFRLSVNE